MAAATNHDDDTGSSASSTKADAQEHIWNQKLIQLLRKKQLDPSTCNLHLQHLPPQYPQ